jgi:hypothetical protein
MAGSASVSASYPIAAEDGMNLVSAIVLTTVAVVLYFAGTVGASDGPMR